MVWLTGISGAGKSTIACLVEDALHQRGFHTFVLDGDNLRHGLSGDLDFSDASRHENVRRASQVARLMVDAGLIVIASFISPFRADRDAARALFAAGEFIEVFVDAPLEIAEKRDPKGLYKRVRAGALAHFTGIDSLYQPPVNPEIYIDTATISSWGALERILVVVGPLLDSKVALT